MARTDRRQKAIVRPTFRLPKTSIQYMEGANRQSRTEQGRSLWRLPGGSRAFFPAAGDFVAFVGNTLSRPLLHTTLKAFREAAALPSAGAAVPNIIPGAGWSDHWSFWQQSDPGLEITDTAPYRNPHYQMPSDTPDRLDYDRMARFAGAMQTVVEQLANDKL